MNQYTISHKLENDLMIFEKDLLITKTQKDKTVWIITSLTKTTYSFLQNINRFKACLMKYGYTFKLISRLAEDIITIRIIKRLRK